MSFDRLGSVPPGDLSAARLLAHWALQIPAALASQHVPAQEDDSHSNLAWVGDLFGFFLSRPLSRLPQEARGVRVGVRPVGLELLLFESDGELWEALPLQGQTLQAALAWVRSNLETRAGEALEVTRLRDYPMPSHPVLDRAAPFRIDGHEAALEELAGWFAAFAGLFERLEQSWGERGTFRSVATSRVWPHHFDLGGLLEVAPEYRDDGVEQIGFGFEPGDDHYAQPYLYVSPHPQPELPPVAGLDAGGFWTLDGFIAAILTGERLVATPSEAREDAAVRFFESAIDGLLPE